MSSAAASDARSGGGAGTWPTAVSVSPAQAAGLLGSSFRQRHSIVSAPRGGCLSAWRAPGVGLCSCGRRRLPAMSNTAGCLRAIATGVTWTVPVYRVLRIAAAPVSRRFRVTGGTCVQDIGAAHVLAALPPAEEEHAVAHGGRRRAEHRGRRLAPAGAGRRRRAPAAARCRGRAHTRLTAPPWHGADSWASKVAALRLAEARSLLCTTTLMDAATARAPTCARQARAAPGMIPSAGAHLRRSRTRRQTRSRPRRRRRTCSRRPPPSHGPSAAPAPGRRRSESRETPTAACPPLPPPARRARCRLCYGPHLADMAWLHTKRCPAAAASA
jgi:hypothetical protein